MARKTKKVRIDELKERIQELINEKIKKCNSRGTGRKQRFTQQEKETIKMYRIQGQTIKDIADIFKCSTGLIHKLIN